MTGVVFLGLAVTGTAVAQTIYKLWAVRRRAALFVLAAGLFMLTQGAFYLALRSLHIGTVYMATALTHVLVLGLARTLLDETVDRRHLTAVGLIGVGLLLYTW